MEHFLILSLAVFLVWEVLLYPLLAAFVPPTLRSVVYALALIGLAWLMNYWWNPYVYFLMAVAGLVAVCHRTGGLEYAAPQAYVTRETQGRIPPQV